MKDKDIRIPEWIDWCLIIPVIVIAVIGIILRWIGVINP